jgi:predicted ArsR family transcriptional regulator
MGIFDKVGIAMKRDKRAIRWQLSEIGEDRLTRMEMGSTRHSIMAIVKKLTPASSTQEVADDMGWPASKMQMALEALERERLVEKVG